MIRTRLNPLARAPVAFGFGWRAKPAMVGLKLHGFSRGISCHADSQPPLGQNGGGRQLFDIGTALRGNMEVPFKIKNKLVELLSRLLSSSKAGIKWWDYDHEV